MDAYIISLNNPVELMNKIKNYKLNPILIEGVNGNKLSREEIKENTTLIYSLVGPKSAVGCAMSHIKTWKKFIESQKEMCFIFEDDAIFEDDFLQEYPKIIKHTPKNFDILYIGCLLCDENKKNIFSILNNILYANTKESVDINEYIKIPEIALGTHSYILTRKGALRLLEKIENKIENHIDVMIMRMFLSDKLNVYASKKRLVYQTSTDSKSISTNVKNKHPLLITNFLSNYEADTKMRLSYIFTVVIADIFGFVITTNTIFLFFLGFLFIKTPIQYSLLFYLLLSSLDLYYMNDIKSIIFHGIIFLLPSLFFLKIK